MALVCSRCGRQYDVTLFQFGRSVRCSCGEWVERDAGACSHAGVEEPRFVADVMLGRLARWLRLLGYDTSYDAGLDDAGLVDRSVLEGRILLTRDRALPREHKVRSYLIVADEAPLTQLRQVVRTYRLGWEGRLFSRCTRCNAALRAATKAEVAGRVPRRVLLEQESFARCSGCDRVYWPGSHTKRMRRALEAALKP